MNKIKYLLKDIVKDPGSYIALLIMAALVAGALYVLITATAANWQDLYCQANPINCLRKGW